MELTLDLIRLGAVARTKEDAIEQVAALLSDNGNVAPEYRLGMLQREQEANTYLGSGIAIPHGTPATRHLIRQTGIAVLQVPGGVAWGEGGEQVRLVVGIAAASDEHLQILRRLTRVLADDALVEELSTTRHPLRIQAALTGQAGAVAQAPAPAPASAQFEGQVTLPNPQGMHARPATTLAQLVKRLGARVTIVSEAGSADATKLMELLSLGLTRGTRLTVQADSAQALQAVLDSIRTGLGDDLSLSPETRTQRQRLWQPQAATELQGVAAADGLVVGVTRQHRPREIVVTDERHTDPFAEGQRLDAAIGAAQRELELLIAETQTRFGADKAAIFAAHTELLADEATLQDASAALLDGHGAAWAYQQATNERIAGLQKLDDPTLAARAADLSDVQRRVLRHLLGLPEETALSAETPIILLAQDLTPSDTARLSPEQVLGFVTAQGGPTSHSAIIARGLGLPAVVATGASLLDVPDGTMAILDGSAGYLYLDPSAADIEQASQRQRALEEVRQAAYAARHQQGATADGVRLEVAANINRAADAGPALEAGAEGVGLMRTEFLFLERDSVPTEAEQEQEYRAMAQAMAGRPLIIRTLDIGGDKEVPYLGLAHEDNSFLGIRGIRLCFERPDLFLPQLRAIARVAKDHPNVHVMFPMVSTLEDFRRARATFDEVRAEIGAPAVPLGVMIEVPSAALLAPLLAPEVDFFSIGTNDLTQYTLAMDRMHPQLARQTDAMHPAVLQLIALTVDAARRNGKWVGVCGGAAGDEVGSLVLAGLGVKELSVSMPQVAGVKASLRRWQAAELQQLAQAVLALPNAQSVRQYVQDRQPERL